MPDIQYHFTAKQAYLWVFSAAHSKLSEVPEVHYVQFSIP